MKIIKPLDNILNTEAKTRILRFLCKTGANWNGRQIAKEVGLTPATTHKTLYYLSKEGVLILHNIGKTHVYSLNEDNFIVSDLLRPLFAKEDKILESIIDAIKRKINSSKVKKDIVSMALFGSINIQEGHAASDIDIFVIIKNAKIKPIVERLFEAIDKKVSKDFGNTLAPYINTEKEFRAKYRKDMTVIKNILRSHTLIYGKRLEKIV